MKAVLLKVRTHPYQMTPQEFLAKYPELNYSDLADLLGVKLSTVQAWMSETRNPTTPVLLLLDRFDRDFEDWARQKREQEQSVAYRIWETKIKDEP
ncbi:helix-turn-helix transcriptional regulator [Kamptonema sp. UHCC 0994]|uniref:helix-turn-helix domain-containing protein n=1 Tax=Kamptonema sp. UHCC 0994 TaxID=3031329 RepID=UPI0023B9D038|nr:helix-turn-helix transcriptional regulator [Kamptonema sp. UHCC 0994]MDF0556020.1 helix-turn-helix transcriptional regulator [Kamptonema sp. UHCC 0994]